MLKVSNIITASNDLTSWASSPGVISGCDVFVTTDMQLGVKPGKFVTLNGTSAEIKGIVDSIGEVRPAIRTHRMDYVTAEIYKSSVYFRVIQGDDHDDPVEHTPVILSRGILLAKVYVTYPTESSSSVFIYNMLPSNGEGFCRAYSPLRVPDGVRTKFYFPFDFHTGVAVDIRVNGVSGQVEGTDYLVSKETNPNGGIYTVVEFTEPPPPRSTIVCNIYLGKIRFI